MKQRVLGRSANRAAHQIVRLDSESRQPLDGDLTQRLSEAVIARLGGCDALLISDYGKGVCTRSVLRRVIRAARLRGLPIVVDPALGADYKCYRGATIIKPNRREAELAFGRPIRSPDDALSAGRTICRRHGFGAAVITLDQEGLSLATADGLCRHWSVSAREVCDVTGAGDTVLAMLGVCLADGQPLVEACRLANLAAAMQVERMGVAAISWAELLRAESRDRHRTKAESSSRKIVTLDELVVHVQCRRSRGDCIAFTNGCFDLLHAGHVRCLEEAAALGDLLIVAINSDASVRRLKGQERPFIRQEDRAAMVAALAAVDYVVVFDEPTPHALLERLRPDVLVKGGTYHHNQIEGREQIEAYGGRACLVGYTPGVSTTSIAERLRLQIGPLHPIQEATPW